MDDRDAAKLLLSDRFARAAQWTSQQCGCAYIFIAAIVIITGTTIVTFLLLLWPPIGGSLTAYYGALLCLSPE